MLAATAVFSVTTPRMAHSAEVPADIAERKVQELRAGGDAQMRYLVIHPPAEPPPGGRRTLFVLPGGVGHADFQPFVTRIAKKALPEGYRVVKLVASGWSPAQAENLVWPTDQTRLPEVKFTTSELLIEVMQRGCDWRIHARGATARSRDGRSSHFTLRAS